MRARTARVCRRAKRYTAIFSGSNRATPPLRNLKSNLEIVITAIGGAREWCNGSVDSSDPSRDRSSGSGFDPGTFGADYVFSHYQTCSGTSLPGVSHTGVIFPQTMDEVIAVSLVDYDPNNGDPTEPYTRISNVHYGPEVELAAICCQYATGEYTGDVVSLSGSSGASAVVAGVAALAWAEDPSLTNDALRQLMRSSGHVYPTRIEKYGYGVINAVRAVGGLYAVDIARTLDYDNGYSQTWTLTANPRGGAGSYAYSWSHGPTSRSVTITKQWDEVAQYNVQVTDLTDGIVTSGGTSFGASGGGGGECDPQVVICP